MLVRTSSSTFHAQVTIIVTTICRSADCAVRLVQRSDEFGFSLTVATIRLTTIPSVRLVQRNGEISLMAITIRLAGGVLFIQRCKLLKQIVVNRWDLRQFIIMLTIFLAASQPNTDNGEKSGGNHECNNHGDVAAVRFYLR